MPPKNILVRAAKSPFTVSTIQDALDRNHLMTNTGNLLFQHAFIKHIYTDETNIFNTDDTLLNNNSIAMLNEYFDAVYLPFANAFRTTFRQALANWCSMLDQITIPVVVAGIGVQCFTSQPMHELASINALVKLFCQKILEKSSSIGVRGTYTAEYLDSLGIRNVDVIGCPSMYLFGENLPEMRNVHTENTSKIAFHFSPQSPNNISIPHPNMKVMSEHFFKFLRSEPNFQLTYIAQDTNEINRSFRYKQVASLETFDSDFANVPTVFPLDIYSWINELKQYDLVIGTRIHGTIAGILAGTPSILICHDSRTRELADFFEIPYIDPSNNETIDMETISHKLELSSMHTRHKSRYDHYTDFLKTNCVVNCERFSHGHPSDFSQFDTRMAGIHFPPISRSS